ncbi:hypothetical protein CLHUN_24530 [Ruminiclostridium hungatei]|uniref:Uncharacterized protein n=1 Tax=Ruminiclostridium hungatei TaxID=48256 RepID=A0A1V4SIZ4_RUMHU|nr:hypothetical protein CLHUN_24530 [Ruminiclostridium hungatei]
MRKLGKKAHEMLESVEAYCTCSSGCNVSCSCTCICNGTQYSAMTSYNGSTSTQSARSKDLASYHVTNGTSSNR